MFGQVDLERRVRETQEELRQQLGEFRAEGRRVLASSSFQTQSVPLLHLLADHPEVDIVMIDTGFLFPETYTFADELQRLLGFRLLRLQGRRTYAQQMTSHGRLLHTEDIEACCRLNKVEPMADELRAGEVWLSGIRSDQTATRAAKPRLETDARGVLRYHPMLDWTAREIYAYIREHQLPKHPLEAAGYLSIGCVPCTRRWDGRSSDNPADARSARWAGSRKTECGLHLPSPESHTS